MARQPAARVTVFGDGGQVLLDVVVPAGGVEDAGPQEAPAVPAGWRFTERAVRFRGASVAVPRSRLKLLRVLAEADGSLTAKELTEQAFDRHTDQANTRYHLRELKKELARAFPEHDGELLVGDNSGYRLVMPEPQIGSADEAEAARPVCRSESR